MNFNFEIIIFYAVVITGILALIDILYFAPKRKLAGNTQIPILFDYARSFFPMLLLVFAFRSFAFEAFRIPSGSLKPTLLVGDFILVNKYAYGIRLPVLHTKLIPIGEPQRGDIVVFREPPTESRDLIKRVIGLPGDHIVYKNKTLTINGQEIPQQFEKYALDQDGDNEPWQVVQKQESLFNITHSIYQIPDRDNDDFDVIVPTGHYFMMGDNRDDSADSRVFGFLPEENIVGKANRVLLSFDSFKHPVRLDRTIKKII